MSFKGLKPIVYGGREVWPVIEGGKGVSATNHMSSGAWAAAGGIGTVSAVNADSYDAEGKIIPQIYHGKTRRERHEELLAYAIKGGITQAKIAIGSGGVAGKGFTEGTQSRLNFLPEKQTDFIWTSICEEFGFVGALAVLVLFGVVIFYGVQTAMSARSQFGRLVAMGVTLNFFFYIMINGLMVMGLIPVVGIPMPLLSYGGSAMLTVMLGFGLLLSVHIHRQVEIPRHSGGII